MDILLKDITYCDVLVKNRTEVDVFVKPANYLEMKYPVQTINLTAGVETDVTTTIITEPYNVFLLDSSGNDITSSVTISLALTGGVYVVTIYSVDALTGVKLKILY